MANLEKLIKKALKSGDLEQVKTVLAMDAPVHFFNSTLFSHKVECPIQWALESNNPAILKEIIDYSNSIVNNYIQISSEENTAMLHPLYWAVQNEKEEMVKILLEQYKIIDLKKGGVLRDKNHKIIKEFTSPLELAKKNNNTKIIPMLENAEQKQILVKIENYSQEIIYLNKKAEDCSQKISDLKKPFNKALLTPTKQTIPTIQKSKKFKV